MRNEDKTALKEVTVNKADLIAKLKENRTKHVEGYREALKNYRQKLKEVYEKIVEEARDRALKAVDGPENAVMDLSFSFHDIHRGIERPSSFEEEYDRAISMLEWNVDDTVTLSANDFNCYVLDQWVWKERYMSSLVKNDVRGL